MKAGKSLVELAAEIERRAASKKDYVAPTKALRVEPVDNGLNLVMGNQGALPLNNIAHEHMSQNLSIPKPYYDRMLQQAPDLLAQNVNRWMQDDTEKRMIRTLDGKVRAITSDRYRPLDDEQLAEAVLPVLMQLNLEIMSSEITDRRLYIKAVSTDIRKDIPKSWSGKWGGGSHEIFDTLSPAIVISNSEVRCGGLSVQTSVFTKQCTNLATFAERSVRKYHIGGRLNAKDETYQLLSDSTKQLSDKALWAEIKDVTKAAFALAEFDKLTAKIAQAGQDKMPDAESVPEVVEVVGKKLGINETERKGILRTLIEGGDLSRYGLHAAVTRYSADVEDYDRSTELEVIGGRLIEMKPAEWKALAV